MLLRAFAKINLSLQVLGRRDDGYHEVRTVLQTIDWFDEIDIELADRFEFSVQGMPQESNVESNLVVRAVHAFERVSGVAAKVRIRLKKNIPIGAGLGGGSADAAVTFMGLQRLHRRTLDPENVVLELRGLGSDVTFFAVGGLTEGSGRGDEVVPLHDSVDYWLVLVDPGVSIATAEAYSWLTVSDKFNSIEGFRAQCLSDCGAGPWVNDFEFPVFKRYPELAKIKDELMDLGAYRAALSGSGSTVFGQFHTEADAIRAGSALDRRFRVKVTKPLERLEYFQRMMGE